MQADDTSGTAGSRLPRLWVISELYYPEETSTGYYLTRIAEGLAGRFDVKVICGQPTYSARGTVAPKHEIHKEVEIYRASGTTLDKNVIPFRVMNMLTLGFSIFLHGMRRFRAGDRVLVVTTPPSMPFVIAVASLMKGAAYTLLIHDNYPEILIASRKTKPGSILVRTMAFLNRGLYKYATKIIVVGRDMRQLLERKTAGLDVPIASIPNWAELEAVEPRPRHENKLLAELGLQEKLVVLYAGNMGHPNDVESIIEAASTLQNRNELHFVFLGAGVKRRWLEEQIRSLNLTNVTLLDPRPRSEQTEFLNAGDIGLVSLVSNMVGVSMPSRTYNILAAGKPILGIVEAGSEVAEVVKEESVGWIVKPGDSKALTETLLDILGSPDRLAKMGENSRNAAVEKYSLDAALEAYRREL
ncbi:MAG TPA: glycosyltransferase family 4 protein [Pyrinomonadaceae bacterium]|nr:glycosyltransferase family 4 protein [Pyrinomonadaceae bacterium]